MTNQVSSLSLYEQDYYLWIETLLKQLKQGDLANIDSKHLIEEVEALGIEQRHKVDSYLIQLLIHLLLYQYWHEEKKLCARGWENEIDNFRVQLDLLFESKTLYNYFVQRIDDIYPKARRQAIRKLKLPASPFSENCPYNSEQILDPEYFPN